MAARPIPEGMTIYCLVSITTGAVRSAMPATAGFLVMYYDADISDIIYDIGMGSDVQDHGQRL